MTLPQREPAAGTPSWFDYVTEPARAVSRAGLLVPAAPWLARAPRGDGHPVLVLPGLLATDTSTALLRRYLRRRGYAVHGWRLGRNVGPTARALDGMRDAVATLVTRAGQPISIVGWSLGGIFARELARRTPDQVRRVVTMGSPFGLTESGRTRADRAYLRQAHRHDRHRGLDRAVLRAPIPVPSTALYSRRDGIVAWRACVEAASERHDNIEVRCPHLGFGTDPATLWALADRLAQARGEQRPFRPPAWLRPLYPHPTEGPRC